MTTLITAAKETTRLYNKTSGNHRLESAGLNALEELLRCWGWTEKIVNQHVYFEIACF